MKILYLGSLTNGTTSLYRAEALKRLGHLVEGVDLYREIVEPRSSIFGKINFHTGYSLIQNQILHRIKNLNRSVAEYDSIWVDGGELIGSSAIEYLEKQNKNLILFNHDDPTGNRDRLRFRSLITAIPYYKCCAVVRDENVKEFLHLGAKKAIKVSRGYDEISHLPFLNPACISKEFLSDVSFIGTWMRNENRDFIISKIIKSGLNIKIWGHRWSKSPHWKVIKPYYAGTNLTGRDYVAAIQGSKICLGLFSHLNRDHHTSRTFEIPYAGGLLCAERSVEHSRIYIENVEAVFWNNADECIEKCKILLSDSKLRESIKAAGSLKVRELNVGNESICASILNEI